MGAREWEQAHTRKSRKRRMAQQRRRRAHDDCQTKNKGNTQPSKGKMSIIGCRTALRRGAACGVLCII